MKRMLLVIAALVLSVSPAFAYGGVNFAWGTDCWSESSVQNRSFACDVNTGTELATASFAPSADLPDFNGIVAKVEICSVNAALPAWWQLWNAGACRSMLISASTDFLAVPAGSCPDPWHGLALGGIATYQTALFPPSSGPVPAYNRALIKLAFALPAPEALAADVEYAGFHLAISHAKTVGDGACAGCSAPAALALAEIQLWGQTQMQMLGNPLSNQFLGWNGGSWWDCWPTPVRNSTWGQIKGMYR